uniref:Inka box actin regulator 1 n=1 Tax=Anas platyrhynchos TaxID=8839 RepID=A0A8B9TUU4_ANAPL
GAGPLRGSRPGGSRWRQSRGRAALRGAAPPPGPAPGAAPHMPGTRPPAPRRPSSACSEEDEGGPAARSPPASERSLEFDSGYSETSGGTWREEEVTVLRRHPPPSGGPAPARRPRPKSTSDACLEQWRALEPADGQDWTVSLLSQSRNRQPLVLGDNCFADLVENWMDLPEVGAEPRRRPAAEPSRRLGKPPAFLLSLSGNVRRKLASMARPRGAEGARPGSRDPLATDFHRFAALMNSRSRQPIICNDVIGYI